jgi:hypothetical protein
MAKRQKIKTGSVLEIVLLEGHFGYAQILREQILFFDVYHKGKINDLQLLNEMKPLFFLAVCEDVIKKGRWEIVGELSIKKEYEKVPREFIQDALNPKKFSLYNPNTGEIKNCTKEEVLGLECCAVWDASHVESRLTDYYNGKPNEWVEQLKIK